MAKQRKQQDAAPPQSLPELKRQADGYLEEIRLLSAEIKKAGDDAEAQIEEIRTAYRVRVQVQEIRLKSCEIAIQQVMKFNKRILFDGTDVVKLANGSLIRSVADKVSIPRDALSKCEEQGFAEVVKIAKSLDREAVEKWTDEKLILIGAERKRKEEYSYDLKAVKS